MGVTRGEVLAAVFIALFPLYLAGLMKFNQWYEKRKVD